MCGYIGLVLELIDTALCTNTHTHTHNIQYTSIPAPICFAFNLKTIFKKKEHVFEAKFSLQIFEIRHNSFQALHFTFNIKQQTELSHTCLKNTLCGNLAPFPDILGPMMGADRGPFVNEKETGNSVPCEDTPAARVPV